jgi:diaminohydroxyphosphoribosylaminopyrimidine deaminase/5-amino-6-(5-phosphoribosylamino)uracil reductase
MDPSTQDHEWMARAIHLSRNGFPAPNPHVGCVIVRDNVLVGEGWHVAAGLDHAEVMALRDAGDRARGATAYVSQEPCNHWGRTGPCSEALLSAGVSRVVFAVSDPHDKASGGGARLASAGVEVCMGVLEAEARAENELFLQAIHRQRAKIVLKAAITADGFSARADGTSKWITGELSRARGHHLRAELGVVIVGKGTVAADDPALTARVEGVVNQPKPYIIDSRRELQGHYQLLENPSLRFITYRENAGPGDIGLPISQDRVLELDQLPRKLFDEGHIGALVEGGAHTLHQFLGQGVWDELWIFQAATLFGEGIHWAKGLSVEEVGATLVHEEAIDQDILRVYRQCART